MKDKGVILNQWGKINYSINGARITGKPSF